MHSLAPPSEVGAEPDLITFNTLIAGGVINPVLTLEFYHLHHTSIGIQKCRVCSRVLFGSPCISRKGLRGPKLVCFFRLQGKMPVGLAQAVVFSQFTNMLNLVQGAAWKQLPELCIFI